MVPQAVWGTDQSRRSAEKFGDHPSISKMISVTSRLPTVFLRGIYRRMSHGPMQVNLSQSTVGDKGKPASDPGLMKSREDQHVLKSVLKQCVCTHPPVSEPTTPTEQI